MFQRKCFQGKTLSENEAADVNKCKGIWKVKSVSDCLASQTRSMAGIGEDGGKVVLWCISFHALGPAVSSGEAADSSKGQSLQV